MIRDDEISPPNPKHRLPEPEKWWLVKLQSSGKLLIMTEESSRLLNPTEPLDPNQFLYHERMPGSWRPRAESKAPEVTAPPSVEDSALARLIEKLKRDQANNRVKKVSDYKAIFVRAFPDLSGRGFDEIWPDAKAAPGVEPIARGRRPKTI